MHDLAHELVAQSHEVTVFLPDSELEKSWAIENEGLLTVVRLKAMKTKDLSYARRTVAELTMPHWMRWALRNAPVDVRCFDGVAWYSPSIFLGPFARHLKRMSGCPGYLILRDIFPQWAADLGLIKRGTAFRLLNAVANNQYRVADTIGVQSAGNLDFFHKRGKNITAKAEVLENWLWPPVDSGCSIDLSRTPLAARKLFVYAGNTGVAQGAEKLVEMASRMRADQRVGFVFVGRGSEFETLKRRAEQDALDNILFYDEISPSEIPGLYAQCHAGMVSLDSRHTTHNIPGKFISYLHAGLPVLASVNASNDLVGLILSHRIGRVSTDLNGTDLPTLAAEMIDADLANTETATRCRALADARFSARAAAHQIVESFRCI